MQAASGPLVLADISGYTAFLRAVASAHEHDAFADGAIPPAYAMMSSLLDGIVGRLVPPFTLSKIEGDAVFAYATDRGVAPPRGSAILDCINACYADFRHRLRSAHEIWTCTCDGCARINGLELKFILHSGSFVIQPIAGTTELVGADVVMAHRLLKNDAAALVPQGGYALVTAAAAERLDIATAGALSLTERYEHYDPIDAFVFPLEVPGTAA